MNSLSVPNTYSSAATITASGVDDVNAAYAFKRGTISELTVTVAVVI